jgi:hypothetical protein
MVLAVSLTSSAVPRPDTLSVVTQARDANLGTGPVSAGATLYDGDRLSTLGNGALTLRSGTSMLYLSRESPVTLSALPSSVKGTQADLSAGALVFSASQIAAMDIIADDAHIHAAANVPTVGQISITGPKTLHVFANRGTREAISRARTIRSPDHPQKVGAKAEFQCQGYGSSTSVSIGVC